MAKTTHADTRKKIDLRNKALAANSEELPYLELPRARLDAINTELKDLTVQQASLTAGKQEVSKRIADLVRAARKLLTFVDVGVKEHYGNRAEKLVEFGVQPFRSQPRIRLVGPDGQPVKRKPTKTEPPATAANP
jgi:predicted transcriptional regulator